MTVQPQIQGRFEWEKALRERSGLSLSFRGALMTLATYATTKTGADIYPSITRLSDDMGISRSAINTHISKALELGWLVKVQDNRLAGRPSHYTLAVPPAMTQQDTGGLSTGQGWPADKAPLSSVEDSTTTDTSQGPPQEVPNEKPLAVEPLGADAWAVVERQEADKRRAAEEHERWILEEMKNAPPFD